MQKTSLSILILVLFLSVGVLSQYQETSTWKDDHKSLFEKGYEFVTNELLGYFEATKEHDDLIHKVLYNNNIDFETLVNSASHWEKILKKLTTYTSVDTENAILECSKGNKQDFWKFAAWPVGMLGQNMQTGTQTITLSRRQDDCFLNVKATLNFTSSNSYEITFTPTLQKKPLCSDTYTIATSRVVQVPVVLYKAKPTVITVKEASAEQMLAIKNFGLHIYRTCDSVANILPDLFYTIALFFGGFGTNPDIPFFGSKPTAWQEKLNPEFIKEANGYEFRSRNNTFVDLDDTEVHSGDFMIITRMDGVDQIIHWGAGSISGHSTMLIEIDGVMNVIESQDGWYWPKHGIQRNTWKQWKQWAQNAGFNVAILPLKEELRKKFDVQKALEFFKKVEGMPYGYHNFIFGWLDVPRLNVPPVTSIDFLFVLASMLERIYAYPIVRVFGEALNKRLNTTNLTLYEIGNVIHDRQMTLDQLFGAVEQDDWVYSDGYSMVCSSFAVAVYKAAGLFDNLNIQATEFTPRDVYQLNFWDTSYVKPAKCANVDTDLPYCQVMGKFKMDITKDGYSTIKPYEHMFEKCPSMPPTYARTPGC